MVVGGAAVVGGAGVGGAVVGAVVGAAVVGGGTVAVEVGATVVVEGDEVLAGARVVAEAVVLVFAPSDSCPDPPQPAMTRMSTPALTATNG